MWAGSKPLFFKGVGDVSPRKYIVATPMSIYVYMYICHVQYIAQYRSLILLGLSLVAVVFQWVCSPAGFYLGSIWVLSSSQEGGGGGEPRPS